MSNLFIPVKFLFFLKVVGQQIYKQKRETEGALMQANLTLMRKFSKR